MQLSHCKRHTAAGPSRNFTGVPCSLERVRSSFETPQTFLIVLNTTSKSTKRLALTKVAHKWGRPSLMMKDVEIEDVFFEKRRRGLGTVCEKKIALGTSQHVHKFQTFFPSGYSSDHRASRSLFHESITPRIASESLF